MGRILIADDAPFFRMMLKDVLEKAGHEVLFAEDGEIAVRKLAEEKGNLDLLILDMVLPKKTGVEVLMDLMDPKPPILCVTGSTMVGELEEMKDLGASDVINKSAPVEEILFRVNKLLFDQKNKEVKRQSPRVMANLQIHYRTNHQAFTSNTFTLSDKGVFIQADDLLPIGTELSISFYLPLQEGSGKEVECTGKIVWNQDGSKPGKPKGMGVLFLKIQLFDSQLLKDYIETQKNSTG